MPVIDIVSDETEAPLPPFKYVEKTVKEVYEAIEKNGLDHARGTWYTEGWKGACVLGQGAFNLGVLSTGDFTNYILDDINTAEYGGWGVVSQKLARFTLEAQLNRFEVPADSPWHKAGNYKAGATIIGWNDEYAKEKDGSYILDEDGNYTYALATYADVAKMAYDILSPYFDEVVTLVEFDYVNNDI